MQKQSFGRGTFTLSAAAFITKMLGFAQGIILARMLGAEGMGLLMMAHPLVPLIITLTGLGLPVAIAKLVSEADALGNSGKSKKILVVSLTITVSLSVLLTAAALFGSKFIAAFFLTDQRAYYAMIALTPIAPIVAISAVLKGYFRGKQHMKPLAFSDILENIVQLAGNVMFVQFLMPYGLEFAVAGAMASAVLSEAFGLLYLLITYRLTRKKESAGHKFVEYLQQGKQTMSELMHIGLPTMGHGIVQSIYHTFQPMLVTKSLVIAGIGTAVATKQYGLLVGYAFPLLFLPSFITFSLSTALVPAISEAWATHNGMLMHRRIDQAMQIGLLVGAPSTVILFVFAEPLTTVVYHAPEAALYLKMLAPIFFLSYFEAPFHAIMLGLDQAGKAMWNLMIETVLKATAIFILGMNFGLPGVVLGINFGIVLITLLNFFSISTIIGFYLDLRKIVKVGICTIVTAFCGQSVFAFLQQSGSTLFWAVLDSISAAILIYAVTLLLTKTVKYKDARKAIKALFPTKA